jgi:hypothetical protein
MSDLTEALYCGPEMRAELGLVALDLLDRYDLVLDAARKWANLTSPENVEALRLQWEQWLGYHSGRGNISVVREVSVLPDFAAWLRSVEEGTE